MEGLKMGILAGAAWNAPHWPVSEDIRCKDSCARFPHVGDRSSLNFTEEIRIITLKIMRSKFISGSHQLHWPETPCSCINGGRCSPLSLVLYVSMWNSCVLVDASSPADLCSWLLTCLKCHAGTQMQHSGPTAAPPFGRVWRTHAIPHISSISDCITQDLLTSSAITNGSCYHSNRYATRNTFCMNLSSTEEYQKNQPHL